MRRRIHSVVLAAVATLSFRALAERLPPRVFEEPGPSLLAPGPEADGGRVSLLVQHRHFQLLRAAPGGIAELRQEPRRRSQQERANAASAAGARPLATAPPNGLQAAALSQRAQNDSSAICVPDDSSRRRGVRSCREILDTGYCRVAPSSRRRTFGGEASDTCQTTCRASLGCQLGARRTETIPELLFNLADDMDWNVRHQAARALADVGHNAARQAASGLLSALADDTSAVVRRDAAGGLTKVLGKASPKAAQEAMPGLLHALANDRDEKVRRLSLETLEKALGKVEPEAIHQVLLTLLGALANDADLHVRRGAVKVLGQMFKMAGSEAARQALPGLMRALANDTDAIVRQGVAALLGEAGAENALQAVPGLLHALANDKEPSVRQEAATTIFERVGPESAREVVPGLLLALANDTDWNVRRLVASGLQTAWETADAELAVQAVHGLLHALAYDMDWNVRWDAAQALETAVGKPSLEAACQAVPGLLHALASDTNSKVREVAARAFKRADIKAIRKAVPSLLHALANDTEWKVRNEAAMALENVLRTLAGPEAARQALSGLLFALDNDTDWRVRKTAATVMSSAAPETFRQIVPGLVHALENDTDWKVRESAAEALGTAGEVRGLLRALDTDTDKYVRQESAAALQKAWKRVGPDGARQAVPGLTRALTNDTYDRVRVNAVRSLKDGLEELGPEATRQAMPGLLHALTHDTTKEVRIEAAKVLQNELWKAGPLAAEQAIPCLLHAFVNDTDWKVQQLTGTILGSVGSEAARLAVPGLLLALAQAADTSVRCIAVDALANASVLAGPEASRLALPGLLQALSNDTDPRVRRDAADALHAVAQKAGPEADQKVVPVLTHSLAYDTVARVRDQAATVLGEVGLKVATQTAKSLLHALADDPEKRVRQGAARALDKIVRMAGPEVVRQTAPGLVRALANDTDESVRSVVLQAVLGMGLNIPFQSMKVLEARKRKNPQIKKAWKELILDFRALGSKCSRMFSRQVGVDVNVDQFLRATVPEGVMLALERPSESMQAYRCPNAVACQGQRYQSSSVNASGNGSRTRCALTPELANSVAMCSAGYDPQSSGCSECARLFGRSRADPFKCEPCGQRHWQLAGWIAQPLLLFLVAARGAETAAGSSAEAAGLANDLLKILLAYSSGLAVVASSVTSTAAFRNLNPTCRAREMLNISMQTAQATDVTYYSSSSDCFLNDGERPATVNEVLLLSLELPASVLLIAFVLFALRAFCRRVCSSPSSSPAEPRTDFAQGLITFTTVAGNQFLPGIAAACVRAVPCFHTQAGEDPEMFMAYSPAEKCGTRQQWDSIKVCGPVFVLAFVVGPGYWLTLLERLQSGPQARWLRFLTSSYQPDYQWWETGRLIKNMLLACIISLSPTSYCPAQQLALALAVTTTFLCWHCLCRPYKFVVLNMAEAVSLFTLSISMVFSGFLAGSSWSTTPGLQAALVFGIGALMSLNMLGLSLLWLWVKLFGSEALADDPKDSSEQDPEPREREADGGLHAEGGATHSSSVLRPPKGIHLVQSHSNTGGSST